MDTNQLQHLTLEIQNESVLADYLLKGLSKNDVAICHTEVYSIQSEAKAVYQCIQACQEREDWKSLHTLEKRIHLQDSDDISLLYMAVKYWDLEAVKALLDAKADVNKAKNNGVTPLFLAAQNGDIEDEIIKSFQKFIKNGGERCQFMTKADAMCAMQSLKTVTSCQYSFLNSQKSQSRQLHEQAQNQVLK